MAFVIIVSPQPHVCFIPCTVVTMFSWVTSTIWWSARLALGLPAELHPVAVQTGIWPHSLFCLSYRGAVSAKAMLPAFPLSPRRVGGQGWGELPLPRGLGLTADHTCVKGKGRWAKWFSSPSTFNQTLHQCSLHHCTLSPAPGHQEKRKYITSSCFFLTNHTYEEQLVTATAKTEPICMC